jgi:hypothetical protein
LIVELIWGASELDLSQEDGEGEMVGVKKSSGSALENVEEEIVEKNGKSFVRIGNTLE